MKLTGQQLAQIQEALLSAFPSRDELEILARLEIDVNLEEVAGGQNLRVVIFKFVTWAESNGRVVDLINGALNQRPGNVDLQKLQRDAQAWSALTEAALLPAVDRTEQGRPAEIDIFLSYSRHNTDVMHRLYADLRNAGFSVWTDEGLEAGTESWKAAIEEAVQQSRCMVVILTPESRASAWVSNEVSYARQFKRRIFPVLASGDVTSAVSIDLINAQWVDVRREYRRNVDDKLLPALQSFVGTPEPDRAVAQRTGPSPRLWPKPLIGAATVIVILFLVVIWNSGPWRFITPPPTVDAGLVLGATATGMPAVEPSATPMVEQPTPVPTEEPSTPTPTVPAVIEQRFATVNSPYGVNVRTQPSVNAPLIRLLENGASAPVVAVSDDGLWYQVRLDDGVLGWGFGEFVTITGGKNAGEGGWATVTVLPPVYPTPSVTPTPAEPAAGSLWLWVNPADGAEYVYVPAGEFTMGNSEAEIDGALALCQQYRSDCDRAWYENAAPQHTVYLDGYWIGRTEVTNAQYRLFMEAGGYDESSYWTDAGWQWRQDNDVTQPGCWDDESINQPNQPVVCVSWYEAVAYSSWLAETSGTELRLPSEAEWEKAARGTDGRGFPWGDEWDSSRLNYCDVNCIHDVWKDEAVDDGYTRTAPVESFLGGASFYGALDMAGNMWEWTSTAWGGCDWPGPGTFRYPYRPDDGREGIAGNACRILRGGSWDSHPDTTRAAFRAQHLPNGRYDSRGFRVVAAGSLGF